MAGSTASMVAAKSSVLMPALERTAWREEKVLMVASKREMTESQLETSVLWKMTWAGLVRASRLVLCEGWDGWLGGCVLVELGFQGFSVLFVPVCDCDIGAVFCSDGHHSV